MFRRIKGQDQTVELLRRAILHDRVAQAYLFHGGDGVGKFMTALYFGMALNCYAMPELRPCGQCDSCHKFLALEHPDFTYLFPTPKLDLSVDGEIKKPDILTQYLAYLDLKKNRPWEDYAFKEAVEIRKESINLLLKRLELSIHEARYRIVIIEQADEMNTQTANAFLKTLEEPPANTVIIMTTERMQMILPTIISRTQPVFFKPLSKVAMEAILADQFDADVIGARTAARISAGNLKEAIRVIMAKKSELLDIALNIIRCAVLSMDHSFMEMLEKKREQWNKDRIHELIKYIRVLASDISMLKLSGEADIVNVDQLDALHEIVGKCPAGDTDDLEYLLGLEELSRKLDGNVNTQLVLINLYLNTKRWLNTAV